MKIKVTKEQLELIKENQEVGPVDDVDMGIEDRAEFIDDEEPKENIDDKQSFEIDGLRNRVRDLEDKLEDNLGRVEYMRTLSSDILEYLIEVNKEIGTEHTGELLNRILTRGERQRYFVTKRRL